MDYDFVARSLPLLLYVKFLQISEDFLAPVRVYGLVLEHSCVIKFK